MFTQPAGQQQISYVVHIYNTYVKLFAQMK